MGVAFGALAADLPQVTLGSAVALAIPYVLAFAAGAMIYVVVEELIPESQAAKHSDWPTVAAMGGFTVMMFLDVALG